VKPDDLKALVLNNKALIEQRYIDALLNPTTEPKAMQILIEELAKANLAAKTFK
jgi:hypothetical protein|tara:strand:+ start:181 stop:342 length:162 start_codon:yes stop_codon:yes gene_type:complete